MRIKGSGEFPIQDSVISMKLGAMLQDGRSIGLSVLSHANFKLSTSLMPN